jgi:hypothetical protein
VPLPVGVALSAGDSKQDKLKVVLTKRELLVVLWLAVEGLKKLNLLQEEKGLRPTSIN